MANRIVNPATKSKLTAEVLRKLVVAYRHLHRHRHAAQ